MKTVKHKYTLQELAELYTVSVATLRNWAKEGLLQLDADGNVSTAELGRFERVLTHRMRARANKQYKDGNNGSFGGDAERCDADCGIDSFVRAERYESNLSESYRNKEGIYYTPAYIVRDMMSHICDVSQKTFLEPCCGGGAFVAEAIALGFNPENIYAYDTDPNAVEMTRKRIYELTGYMSENVRCADFLEEAGSMSMQFDYIYTNPPWGKKLSRSMKKQYSDRYGAGSSLDTASLFLAASMHLLKDDGEMGFLMPDSFFNIATFESSRRILLSKRLVSVVDYGAAFAGLLARACAVVTVNSQPPSDWQVSCCGYRQNKHMRMQRDFLCNPKLIINYWLDDASARLVEYLYSLPHCTLQDNAEWALGVVTGDNATYCHAERAEGLVPIFRGKDIVSGGVNPPQMFIEAQLRGCRQVAPMHMYKAPQKIAYRFISNKIVCCCDDKQRYFLNSANMFVLKPGFPVSHAQLADLLNSRLLNWLFASLYNTRKVLRADLETLPLHIGYFRDNPMFDEHQFLKSLGVEWNDGNSQYEIIENNNIKTDRV